MSAVGAIVGGVGGALLGGSAIGAGLGLTAGAGAIGGALMGGSMGLQGKAAGDAADASIAAANTQAGAQMQQLNYLKEINALPQQFREEALSRLGGLYGMEGGTGSQMDLIEQSRMSPLYQAIMGTQQAGEDAIMRNAAATGGLRSGNLQSALFDQNQRLEERALLTSYNDQLSGLQGLAQLPTNATQIANVMGGIGQTQAQGQIAAAQANQAGMQNMGNTLMSGLGLGLKYLI